MTYVSIPPSPRQRLTDHMIRTAPGFGPRLGSWLVYRAPMDKERHGCPRREDPRMQRVHSTFILGRRWRGYRVAPFLSFTSARDFLQSTVSILAGENKVSNG